MFLSRRPALDSIDVAEANKAEVRSNECALKDCHFAVCQSSLLLVLDHQVRIADLGGEGISFTSSAFHHDKTFLFGEILF